LAALSVHLAPTRAQPIKRVSIIATVRAESRQPITRARFVPVSLTLLTFVAPPSFLPSLETHYVRRYSRHPVEWDAVVDGDQVRPQWPDSSHDTSGGQSTGIGPN